MNEQPDKDRYVMLIAWFLGEPSIKSLKTWKVLGERFRAENRSGILHYCNYDTGRLPIERIQVKSPELFLAYIAAMARCGLISCSLEELADYIDMVFDTGYEVVTICNHLKVGQYDYWEIEQAVETTLKRNKKNSSGR